MLYTLHNLPKNQTSLMDIPWRQNQTSFNWYLSPNWTKLDGGSKGKKLSGVINGCSSLMKNTASIQLWTDCSYWKIFLTFGNAFWSINTSTKFGMTLGVLQIRNIIVIPIEAFVILASLFRTRLSPPLCIRRPSLPFKIPSELGRLWFRALLKLGFL